MWYLPVFGESWKGTTEDFVTTDAFSGTSALGKRINRSWISENQIILKLSLSTPWDVSYPQEYAYPADCCCKQWGGNIDSINQGSSMSRSEF